MSTKENTIWAIVIILVISVLVSLLRVSRTQDQLHSSKAFEQQVKEFADRTWPESTEGKLAHLQSVLQRSPLALTVPEQVSRCETYTAEALPNMRISGDKVPGFTFACLSTAAAVSITRGNAQDSVELVQSLGRTRASIAETIGRGLPSPHEQCVRRAAAESDGGSERVLTGYANCFREMFYFALKHENSSLVSRFPEAEATAYDRASEELVRPLQDR
jgi:hypothetical protein